MVSPEEKIQHPIIGIFDSGVGGFSVLHAVRYITPAPIIYFGDCARAPYGNRNSEEIIRFIKEIITTLRAKGVTHFISACNSMSVMTTDLLLKECNLSSEHYIDMLRACIKNCTFPENSRVLVIGTEATIRSGAYQESLKEKNTEAYEYIFKDLAKAIEDDMSEHELIEMIQPCLHLAKNLDATHILYGCTHYPLVDNVFKACAKTTGWDGDFINPAMFVKAEVIKWGLRGNMRDSNTRFETSLHTKTFDRLSKLYGDKERII